MKRHASEPFPFLPHWAGKHCLESVVISRLANEAGGHALAVGLLRHAVEALSDRFLFHVAGRFFGTPLMISSGKPADIVDFMCPRLYGAAQAFSVASGEEPVSGQAIEKILKRPETTPT